MTTALTDLRRRDWIDDPPSIRVIGLLSVVILMFNSTEEPLAFAASIVLLVVAFVHPPVVERPQLWFAVVAVFGIWYLGRWQGVDNHVFLTLYWCLAVGCALLASRPVETVAAAGRLLVGLAFAFATGWKLLTPFFVDGRFFEFTLLVDERFRPLAALGGVDAPAAAQNRASLASLGQAEAAPVSIELVSGGGIPALVVALTVGTLVVEAIVAVVYLAPLRPSLLWLRPAALAGFAVVTYLMVPVTGFATLLIVMTIADPMLDRRWRRFLVALFAVLVVYTPIWRWLVV